MASRCKQWRREKRPSTTLRCAPLGARCAAASGGSCRLLCDTSALRGTHNTERHACRSATVQLSSKVLSAHTQGSATAAQRTRSAQRELGTGSSCRLEYDCCFGERSTAVRSSSMQHRSTHPTRWLRSSPAASAVHASDTQCRVTLASLSNSRAARPCRRRATASRRRSSSSATPRCIPAITQHALDEVKATVGARNSDMVADPVFTASEGVVAAAYSGALARPVLWTGAPIGHELLGDFHAHVRAPFRLLCFFSAARCWAVCVRFGKRTFVPRGSCTSVRCLDSLYRRHGRCAWRWLLMCRSMCAPSTGYNNGTRCGNGAVPNVSSHPRWRIV